MNKILMFFFIAFALLILSIINVSVAPIINNLLSKFTHWGKFNCQKYGDIAKNTKYLDEKYTSEKLRDLCYRQNADHGLEYSSLILDLGIGFITAQLSLMHYFKIGKSFEKYTGLIGLIFGAIGFVLTLVYVCFSGYIFTQDTAFKTLDNCDDCIERLYSNGASQKQDGTYVYTNDRSIDAKYIKYKDLGSKQYNYDKEYYKSFSNDDKCNVESTQTNCDYKNFKLYINNENLYLYNRWCLCLVFSVFATILNLALVFLGFFIFKGEQKGESEDEPAKIE